MSKSTAENRQSLKQYLGTCIYQRDYIAAFGNVKLSTYSCIYTMKYGLYIKFHHITYVYYHERRCNVTYKMWIPDWLLELFALIKTTTDYSHLE
jgi:hypothetical protein